MKAHLFPLYCYHYQNLCGQFHQSSTGIIQLNYRLRLIHSSFKSNLNKKLKKEKCLELTWGSTSRLFQPIISKNSFWAWLRILTWRVIFNFFFLQSIIIISGYKFFSRSNTIKTLEAIVILLATSFNAVSIISTKIK